MKFPFRTAQVSKEEPAESSAQPLRPHIPVSLPEGLLQDLGEEGGMESLWLVGPLYVSIGYLWALSSTSS